MSVTPPHCPRICAHACTVDGGPPNTLAGLETLVARGVEMVEVDVRSSGDGVLVAHHDERLPDGRHLRRLDSAEIAGAYPVESTPAKLEELVASLASGTGLLLDLKEDGIEEQAVAIALRNVVAEDLFVTTLSAKQVARVRALWPQVSVGLSLNRSPTSFLRGVSRARQSRANLIAINHVYLYTWLPRRAARAKLPLFAWTVDHDVRLARVLGDRRVACVITNRPLRAYELLH